MEVLNWFFFYYLYLKDCDHILLMHNGQIRETGTHSDLLELDGEYARLIQTYHTKEEDAETEGGIDEAEDEQKNDSQEEKDEQRERSHTNIKESNETSAKLIEDEGMESGIVSRATYKHYIQSGGGWYIVLLTALLLVLANLCLVCSNAWLALWLRTADRQDPEYEAVLYSNVTYDGADYITEVPYEEEEYSFGGNLPFYVGIYCGLFGATVVMYVLGARVYVSVVLRAATSLHNALFVRVIESSMAFFDTTPLGRILNRFSKDMDEVDLDLPNCMIRCLSGILFTVLGEIGACIFLPWNAILFLVFIPLCVFVLRFFRAGFCDIKRLDNVCRSRLVSHLSASIQGHSTIRAFGKSAYFIRRFESLLDSNTQLLQTVQMAIRWAAVRLDTIAAINAGLTAFIIILWRDHLSNSVMGFILYIVSSLCVGTIQITFIAATETESCFIAVERMVEYIETLEPEGKGLNKTSVPATWPSEGFVQFDGVEMRYRPHLPLVLRAISLDIQPQEKIGIVGRTGSGKSSLGVALFRLVEICGGAILIDGVDIAKMNLHTLRSRLSIIPQDPVLFIGTIRYNLDPFNDHSDADLWQALEKTHIKQMISGLEGRLEAPVVENGENFSVGERQLICMARALLRKSKVLLLDEATAAIDTNTDQLIQKTIREAFQCCTMLIIAHRLNTVLDCDKILVMDNGQVGEFDTPSTLLADQNSKLSAMMSAGEDGKSEQSAV